MTLQYIITIYAGKGLVMINFVEEEDRVKAYFVNPLTQEKRLIGSCELFVSEEVIALWKQRISSSNYAQASELLELIANFHHKVLHSRS